MKYSALLAMAAAAVAAPTVAGTASWALMIAGFGVVGLSLRRRRGARGNAAPG